MNYSAAQIKKAIVAAVAFALTFITVLLENELIPTEYLPWVVAAIGLAGSYGVYAVRNAPHDEIGDPVVDPLER